MAKRKPLGEAKQKHLPKTRLHLMTEPLELPGPKGKILAIDQGTMVCGVALYESGFITHHGHTKPAGKTLYERLDSLREQVDGLINRLEPELLLHETGGGRGNIRSYDANRGMILSEYVVDSVCRHIRLPYGIIMNEAMKDAVVDKNRIAKLKRERIRSSLRPIKEDVQHAVCQKWQKDFAWFLSPDQIDAIALLLAYSTNPVLAEIQ